MRTRLILSLALLAGGGCVPELGQQKARPPAPGSPPRIVAAGPATFRLERAAQQASQQQAAVEQAGRAYSPRRAAGNIAVGVCYPAVVDGNVITSHLHLMGSTLGGRKFDFVRLQLRNTGGKTANLRLFASLQNFSEPASATVSIPPGATWEGGLTPAFRKEVGGITELTASAIRVTVADDHGGLIYDATEPVKLLSRNDLMIGDAFLPFIAAYVTPNDKAVDELLSYAAEFAPGRAIQGYQRHKEGVQAEVGAIYQAIARLGVHYRNHTGSFMDSKVARAQRVTFPAESIQGTGANCIDGALLFASVFEAAGLDSFIVLMPGHAIVGAKLERGKPGSVFVETTAVGTRPYNEAIRAGGAKFDEFRNDPRQKIVSIPSCRNFGVRPFPYPLGTGGLPRERLKTAQPPTGPQGGPPKPGAARSQVGLMFRPVPKEVMQTYGIDYGVLVEHATWGGPADKAGLKERDILLEFNGQKITDPKACLGLITASQPGAPIPVKLLREGQPLVVTVVPDPAR